MLFRSNELEFDEDFFELEMNGREVIVSVDNDSFIDMIKDQLEYDLELDSDELEETIARVYRKVKK